ncbi:MAG TPA: hypothetical protein DIU43_13190 [Bacteroides uniformis]|nr:hypothetical protein [Bacteroides uniformis]
MSEFHVILDFKALLSDESKVRYAIAGHMEKRFVPASGYILYVTKLRQMYLICKRKRGNNTKLLLQ